MVGRHKKKRNACSPVQELRLRGNRTPPILFCSKRWWSGTSYQCSFLHNQKLRQAPRRPRQRAKCRPLAGSMRGCGARRHAPAALNGLKCTDGPTASAGGGDIGKVDGLLTGIGHPGGRLRKREERWEPDSIECSSYELRRSTGKMETIKKAC